MINIHLEEYKNLNSILEKYKKGREVYYSNFTHHFEWFNRSFSFKQFIPPRKTIIESVKYTPSTNIYEHPSSFYIDLKNYSPLGKLIINFAINMGTSTKSSVFVSKENNSIVLVQGDASFSMNREIEMYSIEKETTETNFNKNVVDIYKKIISTDSEKIEIDSKSEQFIFYCKELIEKKPELFL